MSPLSLERYRGEAIEISTTQHPDGTWTAAAILPNGRPVSATSQHSTEPAARSEALSAAVEALDLARSHTGKS